MAYLHGAYGEIGESKVASVTQADVVAAYIGTAPVNLISVVAHACNLSILGGQGGRIA